jgi:hypothetical protein
MGRGTGIGLKDRARSMDVLRKLVSRCVPAGGQTEHEHIQHRRVAPGLGIRMRPASERPWVSQVPSVTPQTHPRRTLSVAILLKKGVLQCPLSEHMALLRSLSASRRSCPILRSFRLTEGKVGRQTRWVRSAPITLPSAAQAAALTLSGQFHLIRHDLKVPRQARAMPPWMLRLSWTATMVLGLAK